ncbi:MAG: type IV toxin-antitoxin system AbiEi family antitoxin domain-containing protein [Solirubrobacteraceae bacterium]
MGSNSDIDREISLVVSRQHGNVTRKQLVALGVDDDGIAYGVSLGRLYRVHRGVYSVGRPATTALERAGAAVLACGPGAALSHGSAATLWGWRKHRQPRMFEVTVPGDRRPVGIVVHRAGALTPRDLTTHLGIRVTSPARTLLDWAPALSDKALGRAVNDARLSRYLHLRDLAEVLARFPRHPGARRLVPFLVNGDGPTRSELEDAFRSFCRRFELPRPQLNVRVAGREVDAYFESERLIVELDGWRFHSSRAAFERDRVQDADAMAHGLGTVRVTWDRLTAQPGREADRLHAIMRARRPRPPDVQVPASSPPRVGRG